MSPNRGVRATVAATITAGALLSGCGNDDSRAISSGGYCGDVQQAKDSFVSLLDNHIDQSGLARLRDQLPTIAAEAPAGIKPDWQTVSTAVDDFSAAMDAAGLTMEDMQAMGSGPMSGGPAMQQAMDAAAALGSAAFSTAQSNVRRNVSAQCKVDLGS